MRLKSRLSKRFFAFFCSLILGFFSFGAFLSPETQALTAHKKIDIVTVKQVKTNWCWAACSEMFGRYVAGMPFLGIGYRTKEDIVKYIYGEALDKTATPEQTSSAMQYAARNKVGVGYHLFASSWSKIRNEIDADRIMLLAAGYYIGSSRNGGHMVVCTGYTLNTSTDKSYLYYVDPADGTEYFCEYQAFCDGSFNGRKYDQYYYYG